jgi:hypothetical protein
MSANYGIRAILKSAFTIWLLLRGKARHSGFQLFLPSPVATRRHKKLIAVRGDFEGVSTEICNRSEFGFSMTSARLLP